MTGLWTFPSIALALAVVAAALTIGGCEPAPCSDHVVTWWGRGGCDPGQRLTIVEGQAMCLCPRQDGGK